MPFQPGQSGNPSGRPRGSANKNLAMLREAVEKVLPLVVDRALAGDHEAQRLILEKGLPKLKAVESPMEFTLPKAGEASPARALLQQVAVGALALSDAQAIIQSLVPILRQEQLSLYPQKVSNMTYTNAYLHSLQLKPYE